jgi:hypothetical protein
MKHIRNAVAILALAVVLAACALFGTTPEAQIKSGADKLTAATNLTAALLQRDKITVTQAKSYRALIGTTSGALDAANKTLLDCRKRTASTQQSSPDPCATNIAGDVSLFLGILTEIEGALQAKQ